MLLRRCTVAMIRNHPGQVQCQCGGQALRNLFRKRIENVRRKIAKPMIAGEEVSRKMELQALATSANESGIEQVQSGGIAQDIGCGDKHPAIPRREPEYLARRPAGRGGSRNQHAGIEEQPHAPFRRRRISASSSAIQASISSFVNFRGSGNALRSARSRVARKSSNSCFSPGSNWSAAASISASVLTEGN